jgi:hypothetical protein
MVTSRPQSGHWIIIGIVAAGSPVGIDHLERVMAVVEPKPTKADVRQKILKLVVGTVVGSIAVGVIGPIIAAIIIGEIWGH